MNSKIAELVITLPGLYFIFFKNHSDVLKIIIGNSIAYSFLIVEVFGNKPLGKLTMLIKAPIITGG